ncbi:MAG: TIGR03790 family protein [Deltaproteobacteria bacterium]|nr:TIGR03790 family protein [Deltaproteobacteria bacterium]
MSKPLINFVIFMGIIIFLPIAASALEPNEVLVIANRNAAKSVGLARYYMKKRGISEKNLVKLWVTDKETCSRYEYEKKIAARIRRILEQRDSEKRIRCLVIMYGLPLKVAPPERSSFQKSEMEKLRKRKNLLDKQLADLKDDQNEARKKVLKELEALKNKISYPKKSNQGAALDSEIALVRKKDYPLSGWVPNPYFLNFQNQKLLVEKNNVLMVSRLDGPSEGIVKRVIDDSLEAEKKGLSGKAYFDARWRDPGDRKLSGYALYDKSIHIAAGIVRKSYRMPVIEDSTQNLFQPGECPEAALYCGWYSLARYIDAFTWQPGSIGYHIASSECATLKRKDSQVWCKRMLEEGVAATIGPVSEPYVTAFAIPEIFFGFLVEGYLSLAECYLISNPYLSWKMVLIGDPLYRPFKNRQRTGVRGQRPENRGQRTEVRGQMTEDGEQNKGKH